MKKLAIQFVCYLILIAPAFGQENERDFDFHYGATVSDLEPGANVTVWVPLPTSNEHQDIELLETHTPTAMETVNETKYGNRVGRFQVQVPETGVFSFGLKYRIKRVEAGVFGRDQKLGELERQNFLGSNARVPIEGRPLELLSEMTMPENSLDQGQALYDVVEEFMTYDKSKPGYGNGDVLWACDSKTGNCTDFHSLFISLARSQKIPAKFEIGFPIKADKRGIVKGYHCWAWFFADGHGWVPVDISEADKNPQMKDYFFGKLTKDRVSFTVGRDIQLPGSNQTLNYFVYPHVEVEGKTVNKEQIKLQMRYADSDLPK